MRINKASVIVFFLVTLTFFADALLGVIAYYSLSIPSPPVILRAVILIFSVFAVFSIKYYKVEKLLLILMLVSGIAAIIWGNINHSYSEVLHDISLLSKVLYGPMIFFLLLNVVQNFPVSNYLISRALLYGSIITASFILIPSYLGIGIDNYEEVSGSGTRGLLFTGNESGLQLGMLFGVAIRQMFLVNHRWLGIVSTLVIALALNSLQTRFSMLALLVSPLAVLIIKFTIEGNKKIDANLTRRMVLVSISISVLGLFWVAFDSFISNDFQKSRLESSLAGDLPRAIQIAIGFNYLHNRDISYDLFGEGDSGWRKSNSRNYNEKASEVGQAELDWLDLFGSYGTFFSLAFYGFYLRIIIKVWQHLRQKDRVLAAVSLLGMLFYFLHAFVAGHAMSSAAPSGVFMYLVIWNVSASLKNKSLSRVQS